MISKRVVQCAVAGALVGAATPAALAQNWPTRPIQVVSPFTAGNASDLIGRVMLDQVSRQIGQPFVLENRPGGGGTIGVNQVAKAEPDGYTVLLHSSSFSAALVLHKSLPYDTLKDFAPVIPIGVQPVVLVTAPSKGFKTVADLVAAAKAKPGRDELRLRRHRLDLAHGGRALPPCRRLPGAAHSVPRPGRGVRRGGVRPHRLLFPAAGAGAVAGARGQGGGAGGRRGQAFGRPAGRADDGRKPGCPNAEYHFWSGLFVPAKTPAAVVAKLHAETAKALTEPAVRERLAKMATGPMVMTPDEFTKYFHDDVASTVQLAKEVGIKPPN